MDYYPIQGETSNIPSLFMLKKPELCVSTDQLAGVEQTTDPLAALQHIEMIMQTYCRLKRRKWSLKLRSYKLKGFMLHSQVFICPAILKHLNNIGTVINMPAKPTGLVNEPATQHNTTTTTTHRNTTQQHNTKQHNTAPHNITILLWCVTHL